jgi:predicted CopG family antitoxin
MTTISITEDVKKELVKFVSELQIKFGRRIDFNEAIAHLLSKRKSKNPQLLKEACKPMPKGEEAVKELLLERKRDEARRQLSI